MVVSESRSGFRVIEFSTGRAHGKVHQGGAFIPAAAQSQCSIFRRGSRARIDPP
jgi:hypothetical protein